MAAEPTFDQTITADRLTVRLHCVRCPRHIVRRVPSPGRAARTSQSPPATMEPGGPPAPLPLPHPVPTRLTPAHPPLSPRDPHSHLPAPARPEVPDRRCLMILEAYVPVLLAVAGSILAAAGLLIIAGRRRRAVTAFGALVLLTGVVTMSPITASETASTAYAGIVDRTGPDPAVGEVAAVVTPSVP